MYTFELSTLSRFMRKNPARLCLSVSSRAIRDRKTTMYQPSLTRSATKSAFAACVDIEVKGDASVNIT